MNKHTTMNHSDFPKNKNRGERSYIRYIYIYIAAPFFFSSVLITYSKSRIFVAMKFQCHAHHQCLVSYDQWPDDENIPYFLFLLVKTSPAHHLLVQIPDSIFALVRKPNMIPWSSIKPTPPKPLFHINRGQTEKDSFLVV